MKQVLPFVAGRSRIRIWDAGCAMGPEPYTLAIAFAESMGKFAYRNLLIRATDIDQGNLFAEMIGNGVYPEVQLKRIPQDLFAKYFEATDEPGHFRAVEELRQRVRFEKHDLLSLQSIGTGFSLVVCKNVLLHFHPDERVAVLRMFHDSLLSGGFLAMEQTQALPEALSSRFERVAADAQVYRKL